jgi:protein involved in polysaccharide export with SLBB domain
MLLGLSFTISAQTTTQEPTLQPGDTILLSLPGESSLNKIVQVKRDGRILLPEIGDIAVAGLTLSQATKKAKKLLQDVIHDLSSFQLKLKQRRLIISVLGYVKNPGSIDLPQSAGIQEAITAAEGLIPGAQLDKLQVRRGTDVFEFDYKSYLDTGDTAKLPLLRSLDTIFVPASALIGNVQVDFDANKIEIDGDGAGSAQAIEIFGQVKKPGRYEWSENPNLFELINHAGGPKDQANLTKVKILSKSKEGQVTSLVYDMATFIEQGGSLNDIPQLKPRDTVMVPALTIIGGDEKSKWLRQSSDDSIYVMGEVTAPGRYMFSNGMHFLDILAAAKGPNEKADVHNIRITHRNGNTSRVTELDLGQYFEQGDESLLPIVKTGDVIYVPSKDRSWVNERKERTIRILGAVNKQGRYRFNHNMTILDLLAQAGGLASSAEAAGIVVVNGSCCEQKVSNFNLVKFSETGDFKQLPQLNNGDTIYVLHKDDSTWNRVIDGIQDTVSVLSILKVLGGG